MAPTHKHFDDRMALLASIVDVDRYPLHGIDGSRMQNLVTVCSADLTHAALCITPDFLMPTACRSMATKPTHIDVVVDPPGRASRYRRGCLEECNCYNRRARR